MTGLSIGEVATRAGLRASALRYYEHAGLISPQLRVSGRRQYDPSVFNTLALIAYAKQVGFTIAETKLLLSGSASHVPASARWHALARRKQAELDATIANARRMKRLLEVALKCRCLNLDECGRRLKIRRMARPA
jgi:MerR family transcriptional regulator, redox-sensitive transcriptional activator SoxR